MILFHPCPYHFPELLGTDSLDVVKLLETRGFTNASEILRDYPEFIARGMHGFLVEDGHLVEHAYVIDGQYRIHELKSGGLDISDACLARAQAFCLPENYDRLEWTASMGRGHDRRTLCLPCARETWPPTKPGFGATIV